MINKFSINIKTFNKELPYLSLCTLVLYPIIPYTVQSIFLIFFSCCSLYYYRRIISSNIIQRRFKPIIFICAWILLLIFTLFYTENIALGFKRVIRIIPIPLLSFIFLYVFPSISKKRFALISKLFILVHLFLVFFLLIKCFEGIDKIGFRGDNGEWVYNISNQGFLELLKEFSKMSFARSRYFINENEISTLFIHKAYLSLGFVWCLFLSINEIFSKNSNAKKGLFAFFVVFFIVAIVYFTSIPNILSLLVLVPLYIILKLDSNKKRLWFISISFLSVFSVFQVQSIKDKVFGDGRLLKDMSEAKNLLSSIVKGEELDNTNVRYYIWNCSYENIKNNFWFGIGLGDEESVLIDCYLKKGCDYCVIDRLNTHNYYASLLLSGGILVLALFLFALSYQLFIGLKTGNILFVIFVLLFAINLVSENMLSRINGVLFYSIFSGLMLNQSFSKKKDL